MTDTILTAARIRRRVLDLSHRAHVGHIGSCLCVADLLAVVHASGTFRFGGLDDADRDRFVLGKGHAGLALAAALEEIGLLDTDVLDTFGTDGAALGVHPERGPGGFDFSTGSLGHGLGMAVGAALAARIQRSSRAVVALLSDAECNEGSNWEALRFAGHHRLARLVAIVDVNGQQALGDTASILDPEPFGAVWAAAGWEVRDVDGHDHAALAPAIVPSDRGPVVVVARTRFGAGVDFMEGRLEWHYLPMSDEQHRAAVAQIGGSGAQ